MIKIPCYKADGTKAADIEVDETLFAEGPNVRTVHQMVIGYAAHKRQGTHSTKRRGEVAGSAKKPWRQKGTGRARAGERRAPHWRGGGKIHSPKPRDYDPGLPKGMRQFALQSALWSKFKDEEVVIVDGLKLDKPKTDTMATLFEKMGVSSKSILLGSAGYDKNLYLSVRNIPRAKVAELRNFNAYDVIRHVRLVLTKDALDKLVSERKDAKSKADAKSAAAAAAKPATKPAGK